MGQVNVGHSDSGDRTGAAGINLVTILIVLAVVLVVLWFLFTGPLRFGNNTTPTNVNVNPPAQQAPNVNINPPAQAPSVNINPPAQQP